MTRCLYILPLLSEALGTQKNESLLGSYIPAIRNTPVSSSQCARVRTDKCGKSLQSLDTAGVRIALDNP